jgi:hypothetical protein
MAFDNNSLTNSIAAAVNDSFNTSEENTLDVDVDVEHSLSEGNKVKHTDNVTVGIENSGNTETNDTDIDIEDSGNSFDFTSWVDASDHSVNDDSINAGVRSYNLGIDGFGGAAAGSVAGDVLINNHNTVIDQSVSGNHAVAGDFDQSFDNSVVSASGADSVAAGGDVTVDTYVDHSTNIDAEGDVLIDSTKEVAWSINSGNSYDFDYSYTDESVSVDIDDSWNDYSLDVDVTDSFNDESLFVDYTDVDVDVDAIVDSTVVETGDIIL